MKHYRRVGGLQDIEIEVGFHWGSRGGSVAPDRRGREERRSVEGGARQRVRNELGLVCSRYK